MYAQFARYAQRGSSSTASATPEMAESERVDLTEVCGHPPPAGGKEKYLPYTQSEKYICCFWFLGRRTFRPTGHQKQPLERTPAE